MAYKKEEMPKKKCLKKDFKRRIEEAWGKLLLIFFIAMLIFIGETSERMANFILMIELEDMVLIVKIILYTTSIGAVLVNLKSQMKGE
jgi:hypothetical protein